MIKKLNNTPLHLFVLFFIFFSLTISLFASNDRDSKTALVTGATRGIGLALTKKLLSEGLFVVAVARNMETLQKLKAQYPNHLQLISQDLSTTQGQLSVSRQVGDRTIDYLVHNAGIIEPLGENALLEAPPNEIRRIIEVNLMAPIILTNQLSSNLKAGSRILMISSRAGDRVSSGTGLYGITKVALDRYAASLKLDHPHEVLAASVHPGDVDTDIHVVLRNADPTVFKRSKFFREKKSGLLPPELSAQYLSWLLLDTSDQMFASRKHNFYDPSEQAMWNKGKLINEPYK